MENKNSIKTTPKHVFLHLFAIIMLYLAVANFLTLIFQYVNILFPDRLSGIEFLQDHYLGLIRFGIASIMVAFPALILVSCFLNNYYKKEPAVLDMKIRKWLIYFTLFVAGLVIVGDLVRIILALLEGETTPRFILKSLSVLLVALMIFGYYLWDVKREIFSPKAKIFVYVVCGLVVVTVVSGFFIIGSPRKERMKRFDRERVSNLESIQAEILNYWVNKRYLPKTLSDLENSMSGYKPSTDPETDKSYEYNIKGVELFELCADFNLPSDADNLVPERPGGYNQNWQHGSGRTCFERKIDKELYPPPD